MERVWPIGLLNSFAVNFCWADLKSATKLCFPPRPQERNVKTISVFNSPQHRSTSQWMALRRLTLQRHAQGGLSHAPDRPRPAVQPHGQGGLAHAAFVASSSAVLA